jgi:hypothetical protein
MVTAMQPLAKAEGWEARLFAFIASRRATPFAWGSHDCCAFTAGAVLATTGRDAMAGHSGYSTALSAARVIKSAGGIERIPELNGAQPLASLALAKRGDVVSLDQDGRISLGICAGRMSYFAAPVGLATRETLKCRKAWRIE